MFYQRDKLMNSLVFFFVLLLAGCKMLTKTMLFLFHDQKEVRVQEWKKRKIQV